MVVNSMSIQFHVFSGPRLLLLLLLSPFSLPSIPPLLPHGPRWVTPNYHSLRMSGLCLLEMDTLYLSSPY